MMGVSRRPRRRAVPGPALIAVSALVAAAGCESPVPFYPPGQGAPDAPVIAVGAPAPATLDGESSPPEPPSAAPRSADTPDVPANVYAATGPGMLGPESRDLPPRVYVPNAATGTADVIDQRTGRLLGRVRTGGAPTLIVPGWNLRRLWVHDLVNGTAVPIAPRSAHRGESLRISRPGPLYFTPDGRDAFLMVGRLARIDFRHPKTMKPHGSMKLPCQGATGADHSADASFLVASCPPSGRLIRVDPSRRSVTATLRLPAGSRPDDLRLSPDGRTFLVADAAKGGLWQVDAARFRVTGFIRTGPGAHGLVLGRESQRMFVLGGDGTVSSVHLATQRVTRLWRTPSGRSPLAGGVSADGETLWLTDPAVGTVYAVSTRTGRTVHAVKVGGRPGNACVYPQPARYSLGGPGLYR
ncbi:YncE family protein [Actinomadura sp. 9N407]|uniref:YncE family protein n=1 Tax=Actinomadura sp. 9N407 TaxID=3375154 RepID=UPI0037A35590